MKDLSFTTKKGSGSDLGMGVYCACLMLLCVCVAKSLCYGLMNSIIWDCRTVAMWDDEGSSCGFQQVVALLFFTTNKSHVKLSVNRVSHHSDGMSLLSATESNHLFIETAVCLSLCSFVSVSLLDTCVMLKSLWLRITFYWIVEKRIIFSLY